MAEDTSKFGIESSSSLKSLSDVDFYHNIGAMDGSGPDGAFCARISKTDFSQILKQLNFEGRLIAQKDIKQYDRSFFEHPGIETRSLKCWKPSTNSARETYYFRMPWTSAGGTLKYDLLGIAYDNEKVFIIRKKLKNY